MKEYIILITTFILLSCEEKMQESIDFLEPQPVGVKDETAFNKKYRGSYYNASEKSFLEIQSNHMIRRQSVGAVFIRSAIDDSTFQGNINNDNDIVRFFKHEGIDVDSIWADSIYTQYSVIDTLFDFNAAANKNLCRYLKGDYFLSYADDAQLTWKVRRMHLEASRLNFSYIIPTDSLFSMMKVKEKNKVEGDSNTLARYQINPDKKELKKLVSKNTFQEDESWIKLK
jgi:hypothetical protein